MSNDTHVYEVGMGSDKRAVEAVSAAAAALHYGVFLVDTNNPFLVAVYTEDGQPFDGDSWWMTFHPTEEHLRTTFERVGIENIKTARTVGL